MIFSRVIDTLIACSMSVNVKVIIGSYTELCFLFRLVKNVNLCKNAKELKNINEKYTLVSHSSLLIFCIQVYYVGLGAGSDPDSTFGFVKSFFTATFFHA